MGLIAKKNDIVFKINQHQDGSVLASKSEAPYQTRSIQRLNDQIIYSFYTPWHPGNCTQLSRLYSKQVTIQCTPLWLWWMHKAMWCTQKHMQHSGHGWKPSSKQESNLTIVILKSGCFTGNSETSWLHTMYIRCLKAGDGPHSKPVASTTLKL